MSGKIRNNGLEEVIDRSCNCQGCHKENPFPTLDSLCPACREALEVGRLVMGMKPRSDIGHNMPEPKGGEDQTWVVNIFGDKRVRVFFGKTAFEVLRKAMK